MKDDGVELWDDIDDEAALEADLAALPPQKRAELEAWERDLGQAMRAAMAAPGAEMGDGDLPETGDMDSGVVALFLPESRVVRRR